MDSSTLHPVNQINIHLGLIGKELDPNIYIHFLTWFITAVSIKEALS